MFQGVGVLVDSVSGEPVVEDTVKLDTPHFFGHWLYRESGMFPLNVRNLPEYRAALLEAKFEAFCDLFGDYKSHNGLLLREFSKLKAECSVPIFAPPAGSQLLGEYMRGCPQGSRLRAVALVALAMMRHILSEPISNVPLITGDHVFVHESGAEDGTLTVVFGGIDSEPASLRPAADRAIRGVLNWMANGQWRTSYLCPGSTRLLQEDPMSGRMRELCTDGKSRKPSSYAIIEQLSGLNTELILASHPHGRSKPDNPKIINHLEAILRPLDY